MDKPNQVVLSKLVKAKFELRAIYCVLDALVILRWLTHQISCTIALREQV